jgi:transcriptional regulator with XRE-family HTH domain
MLDCAKMKALREKLELTQEEAAKKAGLKDRMRWNAIESGRRASISLATLDKIAKALGVKAKDLLK